jgi:hypothetical protein
MRSSARRSSLLRSSALRRAAAIGRRLVDLFPFTPLGIVTISAAGFALRRYGLGRVDLLYLVIGVVGLALAAICLLFSMLAALGLAIGLRRARRRRSEEGAPPLRLECGARAATGFSLPSMWYLPMIRTAWSWEDPRADVHVTRERGRLAEQVTPARRGLEEAIVRRIEIGDAFALTKIAFPHREVIRVRAVPSTGALDRLRLSRSIAAGDETYDPEGAAEGERVDIRGYAPGDPIRFILWKVFAKTRQLVVRTPERAISPARRAFAYVVSGRGDEPAAGVARKAVETGALGASFVMGADGVPEDARSADEALELLARSGSATVGDGAGLAAFLRRAAPAPATRAIVFVPAFDGRWRTELLAAARTRSRSGLHVVVCTDGLDRARPRGFVKRLLMGKRDTRDDRPNIRDVEALVRALSATGAEVVLVDRAHGRVYAGAAVLSTARVPKAEGGHDGGRPPIPPGAAASPEAPPRPRPPAEEPRGSEAT